MAFHLNNLEASYYSNSWTKFWNLFRTKYWRL